MAYVYKNVRKRNEQVNSYIQTIDKKQIEKMTKEGEVKMCVGVGRYCATAGKINETYCV